MTQARNEVAIQRLAAEELAAAERALGRAERAWQDDEDEEEIDHLAYLTEGRVAIAEAVTAEEEAEQTIAELVVERDQVRLQARERELALADRRAAEAEAELEQLRRELQAEQTERGLVLTFGSVLFDTDSAELKPGGKQQLSRVAEFLQNNPERMLLIEGHTDSTGSDVYNLALSQQRADAVENYFRTQGIAPTRVESRGYGEQFPVASNDTAAGRQQNRRVEVIILDEGDTLPPARADLG